VIGLFTIPLWVMGWYYLFREPRWRPLGVAVLVPFMLFLLVGKAYYPGPIIPLLHAAGGVQLEASAERRRWRKATRVAAAAMLVQAVVSLPITLPLAPQASLARFGLDEFRKDYSDTVGWPELVDQLADAYRQLDPAEQQTTVLLARNYGEAGAIDLYGPAVGLPPAISPHLTYWYWKPAHVEAATVLAVGFDEETMHRLFAEVTVVDRVQPIDGVRTEEDGRPILLCRQPVISLDDAWPRLRSLS
jgi:hypothetical protein